MISVEEALRILRTHLPAPGVETVDFRSSLGRVLAEDLLANSDIPPFDRCAMDGYAVRADDTRPAPVELPVAGESRAGGGMPGSLAPGRAVSIMTGAPVPPGADAVAVVEQCRTAADKSRVAILEPVSCWGQHRPAGARPGREPVQGASRGARGDRRHGHFRLCARRRLPQSPRCVILATGTSWWSIGSRAPTRSAIPTPTASPHSWSLGFPSDYPGSPGHPGRSAGRRPGSNRISLIITGVSMGSMTWSATSSATSISRSSSTRCRSGREADGVRAQWGSAGLGLPGNPISALITFECFVRPVLGRLCGMMSPELPRMKGNCSGT